MSNKALNTLMAASVLTATLGTAYLALNKESPETESARKAVSTDTQKATKATLWVKKSEDKEPSKITITSGKDAVNVLTNETMHDESIFGEGDERAKAVSTPFMPGIGSGLYRNEALTTPGWNNVTLGEIQNPPGAVDTIFDSIGTEDGNRVYDTSIARAYNLSKDSLDPVISGALRDTLIDEAYLRLDRESQVPQQCDIHNYVPLPFKATQEALWLFAAAGLKPETQLLHVAAASDPEVNACEAVGDGFGCGLANGYDSYVDMLIHSRDLFIAEGKPGRAESADKAIVMWGQRGE